MTFSLTTAGILAGLAGLAAALYLLQRLRVRHREVPVVTTLFWKQALEETRARVLVQRFRHLPAYLLLLAILSLLWLGFADPRSEGGDGARTVLLLDASAGMAEGSRFADAKAALLDEARGLPAARREVLACGGHVRTLLAPGEHVLLLEKRLEAVEVEQAPPSLARVARALRREDPDVVIRVHGEAGPLEAPTALGLAPSASGRWDTVDLLALPAVRDGAAAPTLDGGPLLDEGGAFDGGPEATGLWRDLPAQGGTVTLAMGGREHELLLPRRAPVRVTVIGAIRSLILPVIEADPGLVLAGEGEEPQVEIGEGDLVVDGSIPSLDFVEALDAAFVLRLDPEEMQAGLEAVAADLALASIDGAALADALGRAIRVVSEDPQTTARAFHGKGHRAILVDAALLDEAAGFTRSRAFPLFVAAAVRRLARAERLVPYVAVGEPLEGVKGPVTVADGSAVDPLGVAFTPAVVGDVILADDALRTPDDPEPRLHASLQADPGAVPFVGDEADATAAGGPAHPARWLGLLALVLLLVEWWLLRRGRIP